MNLYATRVTEGEDLKEAIVKLARDKQLSSAVVVSAVGSLSVAKLRMAGAQPEKQDVREYTGSFEIVSLTGTIASIGGVHLHISVSDQEGNVVGGHLKEGCVVHTTVELVLAGDNSLKFISYWV
jgi:predicted DNA-binding protein with PD1-like motif